MKNSSIELTAQNIQSTYEKLRENLALVRQRVGRPLTLAEKVLFSHLADPKSQELKAGSATLSLRPDRVAMQDATAQMALLQFAQADIPQVAVPSTVHCDHLIRAYVGKEQDMSTALDENKEVYDFLRSASNKYGIGFWKPGAGIIHQVVLENYAFPGGLMIGTDSHTPNAGGLGMIACGVGGADAVDVMAGLPWEVKHPNIIGVKLVGELNGWCSPKDVILYLCGLLTTKGGTNKIIEYYGPGVHAISCTGKATITNMGAELGATTSIFPYDERMGNYLKATGREEIAKLALSYQDLLCADEGSEKYYERTIEINLSKLEPHVVGPHTPDLARPISQLAKDVKTNNYPDTLSAALIGSCTNSSYEDLTRVADVATQAKKFGLSAAVPLYVSPGSDQIFSTVKRDGQAEALESIGATVLANACGPCIGQWKRDNLKPNVPNSIITSFNRNFPKRNDGSADTQAFIASPEIVVALSLAGKLSFNPLIDEILTPQGKKLKLSPPKKSEDLPAKGFITASDGYLAPAENGRSVKIEVAPNSQRLQLLSPFAAWDGKDFVELPLLLKAKGKCTTDHISPAGTWLKYRGHLDKISDNMFLGAINAFTGETGKGKNLLTGESGITFPQIARDYKAKNLRWIVVGDENYGEGSSREHAAMSPRFLGAAAIITRSFARIHETNLKKQGVLPLTFVDPKDYDRVTETDRISILGLSKIAPQSKIQAVLHHGDGTRNEILLAHTLTNEQIEWFKAGSALNNMR